MSVVNVTGANNELSRLLARVEHGEEVVIARCGKPVAKLVPYRPRGRRQFGTLRGRISIDDRFFEPLPPEELAAWENAPTQTPEVLPA